MQDHTLRVGAELVIQDHVRLTILAVDEDEVFLGITAEPNGVQDQVIHRWRLRLMAARQTLPNDTLLIPCNAGVKKPVVRQVERF